MIQLLHDPANGAVPRIGNLQPTPADFHSQPGGPAGVDCQRCGRETRVHVWQIIDPNLHEQDGVIDCGTRQEVAA